jgi:hypothetical protein
MQDSIASIASCATAVVALLSKYIMVFHPPPLHRQKSAADPDRSELASIRARQSRSKFHANERNPTEFDPGAQRGGDIAQKAHQRGSARARRENDDGGAQKGGR